MDKKSKFDRVATASHVGEGCYLCDEKIQQGQEVRYYSGPFLMHSSCIRKLVDDAGCLEEEIEKAKREEAK